MCGETQINPIDLKSAIEELSQQHLLTHTTGFEKQFNVGFAPNNKFLCSLHKQLLFTLGSVCIYTLHLLC